MGSLCSQHFHYIPFLIIVWWFMSSASVHHAEHIPGLLNTATDFLSRSQIQQFRVRCPNMELMPTIVPTYFNCWFLNWQVPVRGISTFIQKKFYETAKLLSPFLDHLVLYIAHCFSLGLVDVADTSRVHISDLGFTYQLGIFRSLPNTFSFKNSVKGTVERVYSAGLKFSDFLAQSDANNFGR